MAVGALIPLVIVFTAVDWEESSIVINRCRRPRSYIMAESAVVRKMGSGMIGRSSVVVIVEVATHAGGGKARIIGWEMAPVAIRDIVPTREREEIVTDNVGTPTGRNRVVTIEAVGRESGVLVIRAAGIQVIREVAVDAVVADGKETQARFRDVALGAAQVAMGSKER